MQRPSPSTAAAILLAFFAASAAAQEKPARDPMAIAPRATPGDYQAQAKAGPITIGAEFTGHSIATPEVILSTDDYVVVEVGIFGPPEAHVKLSHEDFSIRINGKKTPSPAQPYGLVSKNAKDPAWEDLAPKETKKSKGGVSSGGGGEGDSGPPPVFHVPVELKRANDRANTKSS